MPTISISQDDLELLIGQAGGITPPVVTPERLQSWLPWVKGELKDYDQQTGMLKVELQDSNRPDLWSCEGIARQIRIKLTQVPASYPFFHIRRRPGRRVIVSPGLEQVRPYVAACAAVGYAVTDAGLAQLIQTQEKLADIFGRRRQTVSIGLYRLPVIKFPVKYTLVKPDEIRFTPLGLEEPMSPREILAVHPKGLEYGGILAGHERVPLLLDEEGRVLSFPPIINSREIGEVRPGDHELFVEVTGTDLRMVLLTLNILAVNLADRGATIEPVEVAYPYATEFGKTLRLPMDFGQARAIRVEAIERALGQALGTKQICDALQGYGYETKATRKAIRVKLPPYRNDLMHPVDVAEDVAISRGYDTFEPVMPSLFTVGGLSRVEQISDRIRDLMVGAGYQEIISNILSSRQDVIERMRLGGSEWDRVVEVENPISLSFSCLRRSILPSLLRVEAASPRAFYPHRLFEVGEVVVPDPAQELGSRTLTAFSALIAHASANFSEIHSSLDQLFYYLRVPYTLEAFAHPSFLEGRAGQILSEGEALGVIGELHPEVLERWQITMPTVAFELVVDLLIDRETPTRP